MVASNGEKEIEYITIDDDSENDENCPPDNRNVSIDRIVKNEDTPSNITPGALSLKTITLPSSQKKRGEKLKIDELDKNASSSRRRLTSENQEPIGTPHANRSTSTLRQSQSGNSEGTPKSKKREMSVVSETAKKRKVENSPGKEGRKSRRNSSNSPGSSVLNAEEMKESGRRRSRRITITRTYKEEEEWSADENDRIETTNSSVKKTASKGLQKRNIPVSTASTSDIEKASMFSNRQKSVISDDSSKRKSTNLRVPFLPFSVPVKEPERKITEPPPLKLVSKNRKGIEAKVVVKSKESDDQYVVCKKVGVPFKTETPKKVRMRWKVNPIPRNNDASLGDFEEVGSISSLSSNSSSKNGTVIKRRFFHIPQNFSYCKSDSEAFLGNADGSFKLPVNFPAIPYSKFGRKDLKKYGEGEKDWTVQAVYQTSDPQKYFVMYEGWSSETGDVRTEEELKQTAPQMLQVCKKRAKIVKALEEKTGNNFSPDLVELKWTPKAGFWMMEDITYFHNLYQSNHHMAPVYYFSSDPLIRKYPIHLNICRNVVSDQVARNIVMKNPKSKHIELIMEEVNANDPKMLEEIPRSSPCPSKYCKCDIRDVFVYKNAEDTSTAVRMNYDKYGKLVVQDEKYRYLIECSDACKCDTSCPTRVIQRGQKVPLVVTYENGEKGFGVRAGKTIQKGEFIAEYTGLVRVMEDKNYACDTYLAECYAISEKLAIDALEKGNVTRFINHSCSGNTMFIAAHSRAREDMPLIPRVGVFAIEDIEMGDEITLSYYEKEVLEEVAKSGKNRTECRCNAEACLGWIPTL